VNDAFSEPVAAASSPSGRPGEGEGAPDSGSQLFVLRLWPEDLDEGQVEWRGQVQHALSGRSGYFRDWPTMVDLLQEILLEIGA
jgi:hypothetical protein